MRRPLEGLDAEHAAPAAARQREELLDALRQGLCRAVDLLGELEHLPPASAAAADPSPQLQARIRALEEDREGLARNLIEAENQASRVMSLYVVTYQLHASLEPAEVEATIGEIATDLLGAASFVLLLRDEASGQLRVAESRGLDGEPIAPLFAGSVYAGGHRLADETLASGALHVGEDLEQETLAAIPFSIHGRVIGALLIFRLLSHRLRPLSDQRELLDLIAAHSASALVAARAYAAATRKLRTLEGLMALLGTGEGEPGGGAEI